MWTASLNPQLFQRPPKLQVISGHIQPHVRQCISPILIQQDISQELVQPPIGTAGSCGALDAPQTATGNQVGIDPANKIAPAEHGEQGLRGSAKRS